MIERTYTVEGMTCDHCKAAVIEELERIPGVTGVHVDLATGRVTVRGDRVDDSAVHEAVDEAGYEVGA